MKILNIIAILLFTTALVACSQTTQQTGQVPQGTGNIADTQTASSGTTVEFNMTAQNFEFSPSTITVHKGDHVIIHIVDSDKPHGIGIQGYDATVYFGAGNEGKSLDFIADKTGNFAFYCNVPCGSGHRTMRGQLTVL